MSLCVCLCTLERYTLDLVLIIGWGSKIVDLNFHIYTFFVISKLHFLGTH